MPYGTPEFVLTMVTALAIGLGLGYAIWGWGPRFRTPDTAHAPRTRSTPPTPAATSGAGAGSEIPPDDAGSPPEHPEGPERRNGSHAAHRTSADVPHDDFSRIRGVGTQTATALAANGITRFEDLADLSPDEVEALNEAIGALPGRIKREDWPGQARTLADRSALPD
jgi:predicted flap endonuclease-1-like 5' DNA nuclease